LDEIQIAAAKVTERRIFRAVARTGKVWGKGDDHAACGISVEPVGAGCVQHPRSRLLSSDYVMGVVAFRLFQSSASSLMATASASNTDFAS